MDFQDFMELMREAQKAGVGVYQTMDDITPYTGVLSNEEASQLEDAVSSMKASRELIRRIASDAESRYNEATAW